MWKFVKRTLLALGLWAAVLGVHAQTCGLRDNGDGTMTDPGTGLQIRKCAEGQSWSGGRCTGTAQKYKWDDAVQRYGSAEWRLITKKEALQIAPEDSKRCGFGPSWTSSQHPKDTKWAEGLAFQNDVVVYEYFQRDLANLPVQLVRIK